MAIPLVVKITIDAIDTSGDALEAAVHIGLVDAAADQKSDRAVQAAPIAMKPNDTR